jgi:2-polyprenyl-3-methyl-5-hydroxy-6-metoxy-1,4-benzoquinol methylase
MENSKSCVGLDIDSKLIDYVKKTYPENKFIECDATSDKNLNLKFDIVHVGDVIEHIDNLSGLFKFCKRHLQKGGKVIMRTPNAYCFNYVYLANKYGTDNSNMELVSYILPTHALELARRHKMNLSSYLVQFKKGFTIKGILKSGWHITNFRFRHALAELFYKPEKYSTIYIYEFSNLF